jgi:hypothetical protein
MFDKEYVARYVRGTRGLFRLLDTIKSGSGSGMAQRGASKKPVTLERSQIAGDSENERCPWCGFKGTLVLCKKCSTWVCSSRVTKRPNGDHFQCRTSCGSSGMLVETDEGYKGSKDEPEGGARHPNRPEGGGAIARRPPQGTTIVPQRPSNVTGLVKSPTRK